MDISIIFNLNNMKKTTITILLTIFLFASSYAQSNENANGSTYKLVEDFEKEVSSDGIYLIAAYLYKDNGNIIYLMSSEKLKEGKIKGILLQDAATATITINEQNLSNLEFRIEKSKKDIRIINKDNYLSNSSEKIKFVSNKNNTNLWTFSEVPNVNFSRIKLCNSQKYMIAFNTNSNEFQISKATTTFPAINLYKKVSHAITLGNTGYSTFYYSSNDAVLPVGLTAYTYGIETDENVTKLVSTHQFNAGDTIPAECAVVVKGNHGTYSITLQDKKSTKKYDNILKGTYYTKELEANVDTQYYMLSLDAKGENVGFYWGATDGGAFTNKAHKAYLAIPKSASSKISSFILDPEDDSATGIETIEDNGTATPAIYDLSGRRTLNPSHGIYIMNGKKILK